LFGENETPNGGNRLVAIQKRGCRMNAVLLDNSMLAGAIRILDPTAYDHEGERFWEKHEEHEDIDRASFASFLAAICLFDQIQIETSSGDDWATSRIESLGNGVNGIFKCVTHCPDDEAYKEKMTRMASLAIDIMQSPLGTNVRKLKDVHIPYCYEAETYVHNELFECLNTSKGNGLEDRDMVFAKFLHRGLYLSSIKNVTYFPYHYRGKALANLPPRIAELPPTFGDFAIELPLGNRLGGPSFTDWMLELNEIYLKCLNAVTWDNYSLEIPFIGAALMSIHEEDPRGALNEALILREQGSFRQLFANTQSAVSSGKKDDYVQLVDAFKQELTEAIKVVVQGKIPRQFQDVMTIADAVTPGPIKGLATAADAVIPSSCKAAVTKYLSKLVEPTSLQLMFSEHISVTKKAISRAFA